MITGIVTRYELSLHAGTIDYQVTRRGRIEGIGKADNDIRVLIEEITDCHGDRHSGISEFMGKPSPWGRAQHAPDHARHDRPRDRRCRAWQHRGDQLTDELKSCRNQAERGERISGERPAATRGSAHTPQYVTRAHRVMMGTTDISWI